MHVVVVLHMHVLSQVPTTVPADIVQAGCTQGGKQGKSGIHTVTVKLPNRLQQLKLP